MNIDDDYDNDGNNIVPCPICLDVYCPSKEDGKCPEEDEFAKHYLNTPYTEWEKEKEEFNKMWNEGKFHWNENKNTEINPQRIWNVFIQPMLTSHTTYLKERVLAIIEEHDPSSDRDANPRYWGKTLREAIKSLR